MFLHLDDSHVNVDSISYIEYHPGVKQYRIHFNGIQHSPLLISAPGVDSSESGYQRLKAFLAKQEAPLAQSVG